MARELAEKAQKSADNMERITQHMREIALKTEHETVFMRVITLVTLFFLPATFVSVRDDMASHPSHRWTNYFTDSNEYRYTQIFGRQRTDDPNVLAGDVTLSSRAYPALDGIDFFDFLP